MKAKDFFEDLSAQSKIQISKDLDEDLIHIEAYPPIGIKFFSMDVLELNRLQGWIDLYNDLGVSLIVGDDNGLTTELDSSIKDKINTIYGHFSILGIRSNPDKMEKRLRDRNHIVVDKQCEEYKNLLVQRVQRASRNARLIRSSIYLFLAFIVVSMASALYIDVLYSAIATLFLYLVVLFLSKMLKRSIYIQMNSFENLEHNKAVYWDELIQFNEKLIMKTIHQRMIG